MRAILLPVLALVLAAAPLSAQSEQTRVDIGGLEMTRTDLDRVLVEARDIAASSAYSGALRERARRRVQLIESRLDEGDFKIGDRVVMSVQGEWAQPDTFPVESGPQITLPVMGAISLRGVLRSELEEHMTNELGRFIQHPVVQGESLIRLSIFGEVGNPGFYTVRSTVLVGEALMMAGGPNQTADLDAMTIERGVDRIWDGDALREALGQGATLDQMNLRAGDIITLPAQPTNQLWSQVFRYGLVLSTALLFGVRVF